MIVLLFVSWTEGIKEVVTSSADSTKKYREGCDDYQALDKNCLGRNFVWTRSKFTHTLKLRIYYLELSVFRASRLKTYQPNVTGKSELDPYYEQFSCFKSMHSLIEKPHFLVASSHLLTFPTSTQPKQPCIQPQDHQAPLSVCQHVQVS